MHKRKLRPYQFLTTGSWMIEVKATNPQQAYSKAKLKLETFREEYKKKFNVDVGNVTRSYVTFGKTGFAPVGIYKQVKKKR